MGHRPTIALKRLLFCKKQSINSERKGVGAKRGGGRDCDGPRSLGAIIQKEPISTVIRASNGGRVADLELLWYVICRM